MELQYQHTTFTTHSQVLYATYLNVGCSSFFISCSQSAPPLSIFFLSLQLLFHLFCPSLPPLFIPHLSLHPMFLLPPSRLLLPLLSVCFFILILLPFTRLTCGNALMLLIFVCQSSHPADKTHLYILVVFQLMAPTHTQSHSYTHQHKHIVLSFTMH